MKRLKVAVLMGGPSSEHEVSLKSGGKVLSGLDAARYEPFSVTISKTGEWVLPCAELKNKSDVAFVAMHGTYGEDGTVQSMLDDHKIPYTGSGAAVSALAMNKFLSGQLFRRAGFSVPHTFLIPKLTWEGDEKLKILRAAFNYISSPCVVKPNNQGSSLGVRIVKTADELKDALDHAFTFTREALVQRFIPGREFTCGVLDHGWTESAFPLLPTEIIPIASHFFDYNSKYEPGAAEEITPARLPQHLTRAVQQAALGAHRFIGARGFSRTDMIIDKHGEVYVLEINTIPGLTEESLLPKAALASGIQFPKLLAILVSSALRD
ncbi:MAG: D-alanine--D-alanine ligase [Candidatus Jorgensenbacteria bacterium]|nr:D-alanine--D-alanine ligase [Candidatus Jorgensenbacteria bacterium]